MKYFYLVLLFFFTTNTFAQLNTINSLGKFKINITDTTIVSEISKEYNSPIVTTYKSILPFSYSQDPHRIFEVKKDTINYNSSDIRSTECPGVRVFYISTYEIADILVEDIYLTFEKNKLIIIECRSKELYKALKIKYPKFSTKTETKTVNCVEGGLKDPEFAKDYNTKTKWIGCEITEKIYYSKDCELRTLNYCEIYKSPMKYYFDCDELIQAKREKRLNDAKKNKLKDL